MRYPRGNMPAVTDGANEIDLIANANMRQLLGPVADNLIADVNGTRVYIGIEDGKGHAQELNRRLARNLDLNELTGTCGSGNARSQHGQVIDTLGNLPVEEDRATLLKLLDHVLANFPSKHPM